MASNPDPSSAPPMDPAESVLDLNVMDQLLSLDDGELGLLKEMVGLFVDDTPGRIAAIAAALAGGTLSELADVAHAIQGAAGTRGGPRLRGVAAQLETGGRKGSFATEPEVLVGQLTATYQEGLAALEKFIAKRENS